MASYTLERTVRLPIAEVWALLADFTRSPGPGIEVEVEKEGDPNAGGIGTIRRVTIGKLQAREILDTVDPPHSFTYRMLDGAPMKDYRARVDLTEEEGATVIHWHADFKPKVPFTGGILGRMAKGTVNDFIDAAVEHRA